MPGRKVPAGTEEDGAGPTDRDAYREPAHKDDDATSVTLSIAATATRPVTRSRSKSKLPPGLDRTSEAGSEMTLTAGPKRRRIKGPADARTSVSGQTHVVAMASHRIKPTAAEIQTVFTLHTFVLPACAFTDEGYKWCKTAILDHGGTILPLGSNAHFLVGPSAKYVPIKKRDMCTIVTDVRAEADKAKTRPMYIVRDDFLASCLETGIVPEMEPWSKDNVDPFRTPKTVIALAARQDSLNEDDKFAKDSRGLDAYFPLAVTYQLVQFNQWVPVVDSYQRSNPDETTSQLFARAAELKASKLAGGVKETKRMVSGGSDTVMGKARHPDFYRTFQYQFLTTCPNFAERYKPHQRARTGGRSGVESSTAGKRRPRSPSASTVVDPTTEPKRSKLGPDRLDPPAGSSGSPPPRASLEPEPASGIGRATTETTIRRTPLTRSLTEEQSVRQKAIDLIKQTDAAQILGHSDLAEKDHDEGDDCSPECRHYRAAIKSGRLGETGWIIDEFIERLLAYTASDETSHKPRAQIVLRASFYERCTEDDMLTAVRSAIQVSNIKTNVFMRASVIPVQVHDRWHICHITPGERRAVLHLAGPVGDTATALKLASEICKGFLVNAHVEQMRRRASIDLDQTKRSASERADTLAFTVSSSVGEAWGDLGVYRLLEHLLLEDVLRDEEVGETDQHTLHLRLTAFLLDM